MAKGLASGQSKEYGLTSDLLLQFAEEMLADGDHPRALEIARKAAPDLLRAAEAMNTLRRRIGPAE